MDGFFQAARTTTRSLRTCSGHNQRGEFRPINTYTHGKSSVDPGGRRSTVVSNSLGEFHVGSLNTISLFMLFYYLWTYGHIVLITRKQSINYESLNTAQRTLFSLADFVDKTWNPITIFWDPFTYGKLATRRFPWTCIGELWWSVLTTTIQKVTHPNSLVIKLTVFKVKPLKTMIVLVIDLVYFLTLTQLVRIQESFNWSSLTD